jgi:hypothetical protein
MTNTQSSYPGEQYDIAVSMGFIPADIRADIAEYQAGLAWGRTEGIAAVPLDTVRNSISGMHYAESAYVQCAEIGMSERFCRGAFDAVYRLLAWGNDPS